MKRVYVKKVVHDGGISEQKDYLGIATVIISTIISIILVVLAILVFVL